MPYHEDADVLVTAIQGCLTPEAVALIAAKLQVSYCGGRPNVQMTEAEKQCQWFTARLIEMLGENQFRALCDELGV